MAKTERTKKEKRINRNKDIAYSGIYGIASFIASLAYLLADVVFEDSVFVVSVLVILLVTFFASKVYINKLGKAIEADDKRAKKVCGTITEYSSLIGYLSYILFAVTIVVPMYI